MLPLHSRPLSEEVFRKARELFVGGVNSPVRSFRGVGGGTPVIPQKGRGAYLYDPEGNRYLDYILSYGPLILGHAPRPVLAEVRKALRMGTSFGMPTPYENELGALLQGFFPELQRIRLVNSGTEAAMSAIRLARAVTGREGIVKFSGCYHGHADPLLARAGSGVATLGVEGSKGVPRSAIVHTHVLPFNDHQALQRLLEERGGEIAAVILEVIPCNTGMILPEPAFLTVLRKLPEYGVLLIADEVLTGMRLHPGGAYQLFGLKPDLVLLGKVIGGGFPLAAYGGRKEIMEQLAPLGEVYQAGTLSGNPIACAAGVATLQTLQEENPYPRFHAYTARLKELLEEEARRHGIPLVISCKGSIFSLFFGITAPPRNEDEVRSADPKAYARFFWGMLQHGVHLAPSPYEVGFTSTAHRERELHTTVEAARKVFSAWERLDLPEKEAPG